MDFDLNDEQRMMKESLDRTLADRYGFKQRETYAKTSEGFSRELWATYAELGLLALPFSEDDGGFGGGPQETMIVMESLGTKLALEPYIASIVLAGGLLRHAGSPEQKERYIGALADGSKTASFAHSELGSRYTLSDVSTTATKDGDGWVLNGSKGLVLQGDSADTIIVSARVSGGRADRDGLGLFIISGEAPGVVRHGYETQDGQHAAEITLTNVKVGAGDVLGEPGKAYPVISRVVDEATAAVCAEAVGAMDALTKLTVDYLKTRKQFGVTIGSFQVLQHRAADMLIATEQAKSMTMYATMMAGSDDAAEREKAVSAAKIQVAKSGRTVGQEATQLHGGIGMTMEYEGGHYFKRLTMIASMFGDADYHLRRLAATDGLFA